MEFCWTGSSLHVGIVSTLSRRVSCTSVARFASRYHAFKIFVPDDAIEVLDITSLIERWQSDLLFTRNFGDEWLTARRSLALVVPSVVLPESNNLLLNPMHSRANELRVMDQQPFTFDSRLRPA